MAHRGGEHIFAMMDWVKEIGRATGELILAMPHLALKRKRYSWSENDDRHTIKTDLDKNEL